MAVHYKTLKTIKKQKGQENDRNTCKTTLEEAEFASLDFREKILSVGVGSRAPVVSEDFRKMRGRAPLPSGPNSYLQIETDISPFREEIRRYLRSSLQAAILQQFLKKSFARVNFRSGPGASERVEGSERFPVGPAQCKEKIRRITQGEGGVWIECVRAKEDLCEERNHSLLLFVKIKPEFITFRSNQLDSSP